MISIKEMKKKANSISSIKPGAYHAEVIEVAEDEKYVDGTAFIVKYKLYDGDGNLRGDFRETFYNNTNNARTRELAEFMEKIGVDEVDDLIGVKMSVEIKFRITSYGKSLPSIISRTPLSPPSSDQAEGAQ